MNKQERTKLIVAGVLFAVAVVSLAVAFTPGSSPSTGAAAAAPTTRQSTFDVLNKADADSKVTVAR